MQGKNIATKKLTYGKVEKLKSRKLIEHLFKNGKSSFVFPLKVLYDFTEETTVPLQVGVTTSSRNFKKAVQRNRIKRILRETYRLQKAELQDTLVGKKKSLVLFFIYVGKEMPEYSLVHQQMEIILKRINNHLLNDSDRA